MKRLLSLLLSLVLLLNMLPSCAAADETASLRQELEEYGSIDMAMNVYASNALRFYRSDFAALLSPGTHAFRQVVDDVYAHASDRYDSLNQLMLNLGYAYAEGDGSWQLEASQVALYMKYLLFLADMENMPFDEALHYVQSAMPQRNKQLDRLNFLADLLTVGFDALSAGFLKLGDGILKGGNAIPEGKVFYQALAGAFKGMSIFNNAADTITGITSLLESSVPLKGLTDSYQRTAAGLGILENLLPESISDFYLLTARNTLFEAYTDFQQEMQQLSGDDTAREKLQDPAYLNNRFNAILSGKTQTYLLDKTMETLELTGKLADVFLTGGLASTTRGSLLHLGEELIGTKSTYTHFHAIAALDELYQAVADNMHTGDTWQSRYAYAQEVQRLCRLAMLGETHVFQLVNADAGAGRNLWNKISKEITGQDQLQANQLWYDLTMDYLASIHAKAQEYMDALMNHYAALSGISTDISTLLGHEQESVGHISGTLVKDEWFALPDGSGLPDYNNPNPEAGEPVKDTAVQLLCGETVLAQTVTDGGGCYTFTYPRHLAQGPLTIRVDPGQEAYATRDMAGPAYAAFTLPSYYRFNADLESPAAADGSANISVSLPYADDYFLLPEEYSHDLALASLGLSAAASQSGLIHAAWASLGYHIVSSGFYDLLPNSVADAAPYTIAVKTFTDPDAREGEPSAYTVVGLCVGSPLDASGMAHAIAAGDASAAAAPIASELERCILEASAEGVPLRLWVTGFSWGGKVADAVIGALVGRPALTGKYTSAGFYTYAVPDAMAAWGNHFVYEQDLIGMGLTEAAAPRFTFGQLPIGAGQQRIASIFHTLTQGNTAYDPAFYRNPSVMADVLKQLPRNDQRQALITAMIQWRMLQGADGTDFRLLDTAVRHELVRSFCPFSASAEQAARLALASAPLPVAKALPVEAEEELLACLTDIAALAEMHAGAPLSDETAAAMLDLFFVLGDDLGNPTSAQSSAFAHHPEMYLAWLLALDGESLTALPEPDAFGGRILELPTNLRGTVINEDTLQPIPYATVTLTFGGQTRILATDENGQWKTFVQPCDVALTFEQAGFEPAYEAVAQAQLEAGIVELTTYMHKLPLPTLIVTTENILEEGDLYRADIGRPRVWSAINENFGQAFDEATDFLYRDAEQAVSDVRSATCHHHTGTHTVHTDPQNIYSTGYLLSMVITDGSFHCNIGHNVNKSHAFTFDVATGRQLFINELYHPDNPQAFTDFIALMQSCAQAEGNALSQGDAQMLYNHLLKPEGTRGKYANWSLSPEGLEISFDNLETGLLTFSSIHMPYDQLRGILADEYLPAAPVGHALCRFTSESPLNRHCINTPDNGPLLELRGLASQIWVREDYGSRDETPSDAFRFFYAYGLDDALIHLPAPLLYNITVQWEDSEGIHFCYSAP